ncbi:ubiquitin activating enzyme E1 [Trichuris trichiura]|uniref:E1 ubiquitin-activating enzyme n=1 Tax=Trichuris trichiura TaxID=36087 RepID=A0A077YYH9_TRITR|nr:ubiquitin activating enzyme E1 [Trichuris trichiura]
MNASTFGFASGQTINGDVRNGAASAQGSFDPQLYSRQIYVLGEQAMRRLRISSALISGIGGAGVEIAKNLILGGVRQVTIHDCKNAQWRDLSAQYYLDESSIGKNRAVQSLGLLEELNDSVTVNYSIRPLNEDIIREHDVRDVRTLRRFDCSYVSMIFQLIIVTEMSFDEQCKVNEMTRREGKKFMSIDCRGLFGYVFNDFGPNHVINDSNGEPCTEVLLEHIDRATGEVTTLESAKHGLEDGDYVVFSEVKGMVELNNCEPKKVRVIKPFKFAVDGLSNFSEYIEGGKVKQVKMPTKMEFKPLNESIREPEFLISDFSKMDRPNQMHLMWRALYKFCQVHGRMPRVQNLADAEQIVSMVEELNASALESLRVEKVDARLAKLLSFQALGNVAPITGFIGGLAAQEAMKALTGIFTPVKQWFYFDAIECLSEPGHPYGLRDERSCAARQNRYDGQTAVFGHEFQEALAKQRWFIVGAGAIGCELLKYFSMMGVASSQKGCLFVTDMDTIEVSNLNRQFLFRKHDVGKKKSDVAVGAAKEFNPSLNLKSMCERVCGETENIFDDEFFESLNGVANALDNVEARTYMDRRCVYYRLPLLESGTQGPKGNVQVVYPHLTESYSSSQDPPERSIPICTLKNFPNAIEHTIQWARDLFEGAFTNPAEMANQFLEDPRAFFERVKKMHAGQMIEMLDNVYRVLSVERPETAEDCVVWARNYWEKCFNYSIRQLLHNFPPDQTTSLGAKFWSGSKRCPHPLRFDVANTEHLRFIFAAAYLRSIMYGLKPVEDMSSVADIAKRVSVPSFEPKSGVKIAVTEEEATRMNSEDGGLRPVCFLFFVICCVLLDEQQFQELHLLLAKLKPEKSKRLFPIDFEKDDDSNYHMEFVTTASNLRAENYDIEKADLLKTKQIAGRIIPAIATTTAAVAGLACLEFYKVVLAAANDPVLERFKNSFINLALPYFGFAEPVKAAVKKYYDTRWTLWDRFEIQGDITLQQLVDYMKENHQLEVTMLSQGVTMLFSFFLTPAKRKERMGMKISELVQTISNRPIPEGVKAIVLELMCTDEHGEDVEVPYVKYYLPSMEQC